MRERNVLEGDRFLEDGRPWSGALRFDGRRTGGSSRIRRGSQRLTFLLRVRLGCILWQTWCEAFDYHGSLPYGKWGW